MSNYSSAVLADNPIRYYRLDETSGTVATDSGSQGQNGTIAGGVTLGQPSLIAGDSDTAMLFDGASGQIAASTTGLPMGANPWSIECWVKPSSIPGRNSTLIQFGNNSDVYLFYSSSAVMTLSTPGGQQTGLTLQAGKIYYLLGQYDGANLTLYVGDTATGTLHTYGPTAVGSLSIGSNSFRMANDPFSEFFPGVLDEIAFYNANLSADRVAAHYQAGFTAWSITESSTLAEMFTLSASLNKSEVNSLAETFSAMSQAISIPPSNMILRMRNGKIAMKVRQL